MGQKPHICICICTYKRPEMLRRLLSKVEEQETEGLFNYSIVIVDNDRSESARQTVESFARQSKISIKYYVESEQNIALARNKAVATAKGEFVVIFDADFVPKPDFLQKSIHFFTDPKVGMVQGRWEHLNREYSDILGLRQHRQDI